MYTMTLIISRKYGIMITAPMMLGVMLPLPIPTAAHPQLLPIIPSVTEVTISIASPDSTI